MLNSARILSVFAIILLLGCDGPDSRSKNKGESSRPITVEKWNQVKVPTTMDALIRIYGNPSSSRSQDNFAIYSWANDFDVFVAWVNLSNNMVYMVMTRIVENGRQTFADQTYDRASSPF